jgi:hypothetical protein
MVGMGSEWAVGARMHFATKVIIRKYTVILSGVACLPPDAAPWASVASSAAPAAPHVSCATCRARANTTSASRGSWESLTA